MINVLCQHVVEGRIVNSTVNTTQFQRFCDHVDGSIKSLKYNGYIPKHDINFYDWNADAAENNPKQRKNINIYI